MTAPTRITESELLDALSQSIGSDAPEDAMTTRELREHFKLSQRTLTTALQQLHKEGRLQRHPVTRTAYDGRQAKIVAYTITPAAKTPKKRKA